MYPEVEEYFRAKLDAENTHDSEIAELDFAYNNTAREARYAWKLDPTNAGENWDSFRQQRGDGLLRDAYRTYQNARNASDQKYTDAIRASATILRESKDLAVAWIASNSLRDYPDYSAAVLGVLPAEDTSILWDIKRQHGMCDEFDRLYARADAEGVFNGGKKAPGARELAALHNWMSRSYGDRYARDIRTQMSTYIKAVKEHYEAQLAEAKAEWQGLDEARRSEGARKAAVTRAANRETVAVNGNHPDVTMENDAVVTPQANPFETLRVLPMVEIESFESVSEIEEKVSS